MARRQRVLKRPTILPDKKYGSVLVSRMINRIMWSGKKTTAAKIVEDALELSAKELEMEPVDVLQKALEGVQPTVEVKGVRVGGANYQVPMEPYPARAMRLGLTWIVDAARKMKGKPMAIKLSEVLTQAVRGEGAAVEKRDSVHAQAAANKAFAHFAQRTRNTKKK